MSNNLDNDIKLISSTQEGFDLLAAFRKSIPAICKSQIESIGFGFSVFNVTYKELYGKEAMIPKDPRRIMYDESWMRVYYENMTLMIPYKSKPIEIAFVGDAVAAQES